MNTSETEVVVDELSVTSGDAKIEWDSYGTQFDSMCKIIPAYQENIDLVLDHVRRQNVPADANVCDLGAGTGNFVLGLSTVLPDAHFVHVDSSPVMNATARAKYSSAGLDVAIQEKNIQDCEFEPESFDLILCVNALFSAAPQDTVLRMIRNALKPTGVFVVIDFGRKQRTSDWTLYVIRNMWKDHGVRAIYKILTENREGIKQNRRAFADQKSGAMWMHTTEEFGRKLEESGFVINHLQTCYRDYCDFAVSTVSRDST